MIKIWLLYAIRDILRMFAPNWIAGTSYRARIARYLNRLFDTINGKLNRAIWLAWLKLK